MQLPNHTQCVFLLPLITPTESKEVYQGIFGHNFDLLALKGLTEPGNTGNHTWSQGERKGRIQGTAAKT